MLGFNPSIQEAYFPTINLLIQLVSLLVRILLRRGVLVQYYEINPHPIVNEFDWRL